MLLQNITLNSQYPYRLIGATASNIETGYMPSQHGIGVARQFHRWMAFNKAESFPTGYNPGIFMPRVHSNMSSSREAEMTFVATASGVLGMPGSGAAPFALSASAIGGLIASTNGTAVFSIYANTPALSGTIKGSGAAAFGITASGSISATADIAGAAFFYFDGAATAYPLDDTSPVRTASASFSFSGALISYALGHMTGTTDVSTELTASSIVSAVFGATATEWNQVGTMGAKLNSAASGGVDYQALAGAVREELMIAPLLPVDVQQINSTEITGTGVVSDKWRPA